MIFRQLSGRLFERAEYAADLARLSEAGLIEFDDDLIKLTRSGALLSNEVFATFV